jgi:hypothetical protein
MNVWSKGDDAAVCLSYLYHGVKTTPELLAALSHLTTGSIRMRHRTCSISPRMALADCQAWLLRRTRSGRECRQRSTSA